MDEVTKDRYLVLIGWLALAVVNFLVSIAVIGIIYDNIQNARSLKDDFFLLGLTMTSLIGFVLILSRQIKYKYFLSSKDLQMRYAYLNLKKRFEE